MKLGKPVYDSAAKLYNCSVSDGARFTVRREEGKFVSDLNTFVDKNILVETIVKLTNGWFTKPLTQEYLTARLNIDIPTDIPESFEGEIEYQLQLLIISKDVFLLRYAMIGTKEDEKICIQFEEIEAEKGLGINSTRQVIKEKVLKARSKAARALFLAERLTQEYYEQFGEDTDWEDEIVSD